MEERQYRYNLIPFVEIRRFWVYRKQLGLMAVVTNLFGNVIGFLPFGFILPVILDKMRSGWLIVLAGFGLSVTVEVIQLITKVGCFDVDDMILNTAGAALGYLLFYLRSPEEKKFMAKRYRYAFAKKREAQQGKLSAVLAAVSLVLFVTAVLLAFFCRDNTDIL